MAATALRGLPRALSRARTGTVLPANPLVAAVTHRDCPTGARAFRATAPRSTTVLCVRKGGEVVLIADGQVTLGASVLKPNVRKTRRISDTAVAGFAGSTADAFTLFERLEAKVEEHSGQLTRAAVELAKMWRLDKYLRRLDAAIVIADRDVSLQITGNGDVLEPHDGVVAIGSGSPYALAAARALVDIDGLSAREVAEKAMRIAADACVYTNHNFTSLSIDAEGNISETKFADQEPKEP